MNASRVPLAEAPVWDETLSTASRHVGDVGAIVVGVRQMGDLEYALVSPDALRDPGDLLADDAARASRENAFATRISSTIRTCPARCKRRLA